MKDRLFEIWFALRCGVANREFQLLLDRFDTPYEVFNAEPAELETLGLSPRFLRALCDKDLQESYRILEFCRENEVGLLFWQDEEYPSALRALRDPPVLLYYRGQLRELRRRLFVSVVGTRRMSEYGKRMAYKLGYELASAGAVVVSGMALGNDGVAAAGALAAGGKTVAVLGSGIDVAYPTEHRKLFDTIAESGLVITEFPPSTPPEGRNFPVRNRIISGLSTATVVVEGSLRSGALITARTAIIQGRDIYAFPGNVGETNSAGTNQLILDGAAVVLRARDVLENYAPQYPETLNMNRLLRAETLSDPVEEVFDRYGVYIRTAVPEKNDNTPAEKAPSRPRTSSSRGRAPRAESPRADGRRGPSPKGRPADTPRNEGDTPVETVGSAPRVHEPAPPHGDASERALRSLNDTQRGIFEALPLDRAVPVDYLTREGFAMSDIMATMTILEIKGLVISLPGGLYSRK